MHFFQDKTNFYSIGGERVKAFLQGIITCNVETLEDCAYGLILTPKGRFICDLFVYRCSTETELLLETNRCNTEALLRVLDLYNFKRSIVIQEKAYFSYVGIPKGADACATQPEEANQDTCRGPRIKKLTDAVRDVCKFLEIVEGASETKTQLGLIEKCLFCVRDPRNRKLGFRVVLSSSEFPTSEVCHEEYQRIRIMSKISEAGKELKPNTFPLEYAMDYAFDFNKGCYVGQEVISRFRIRDFIERALFCLQSEEGASIEEGDKIYLGDDMVGCLSSCCQNYGLAVLPKCVLKQGAIIKHQSGKPVTILV
ncbi:aminomethyltransferase [Neorickettsia sennetsu]|uniref:Aminomethyl transferase family protein n=1 Tax=Ehrlichia sennetsu (strain ATCC VR-367 / Miyayama) TaxID=222891 RepID=Q2GE88_EHRS3|nr:aminomethyltransferase [Neorickettsia sennetsu]ABD46268.1 aminomethyl transferase family protein [Neorickettsia sennetsu str. Miyayama]